MADMGISWPHVPIAMIDACFAQKAAILTTLSSASRRSYRSAQSEACTGGMTNSLCGKLSEKYPTKYQRFVAIFAPNFLVYAPLFASKLRLNQYVNNLQILDTLKMAYDCIRPRSMLYSSALKIMIASPWTRCERITTIVISDTPDVNQSSPQQSMPSCVYVTLNFAVSVIVCIWMVL